MYSILVRNSQLNGCKYLRMQKERTVNFGVMIKGPQPDVNEFNTNGDGETARPCAKCQCVQSQYAMTLTARKSTSVGTLLPPLCLYWSTWLPLLECFSPTLTRSTLAWGCTSETTDMSAVNTYHIGMCECTDTTNFTVLLTVGGDCMGDRSNHQVLIPKCVQEGSTVWLVNVEYSQRLNQWVETAPPFRAASLSCIAANYDCIQGTSYPTRYYTTYASIHGSFTGESILTAKSFHTSGQGSGSGSAVHGTFAASSPAIRCCGFNEETKLS